jgi:RNA-binding protein with serine-rich domain 1
MAVTGAAVGTEAETAAGTVARPATALPDTQRFVQRLVEWWDKPN